MNIWVYDLSTLTYSFDVKRGYINIYSKNGELLSSRASKKNEKKEEQIFQALDNALKEGRKIGSTVIYGTGGAGANGNSGITGTTNVGVAGASNTGNGARGGGGGSFQQNNGAKGGSGIVVITYYQ